MKQEALTWLRGLEKHDQWLAIERWRLLKERGSDWPAALILNSEEIVERIWAAEKARKVEKSEIWSGDI